MQEPFWITNFTAFLGISHTYYNIMDVSTIKRSVMLNGPTSKPKNANMPDRVYNPIKLRLCICTQHQTSFNWDCGCITVKMYPQSHKWKLLIQLFNFGTLLDPDSFGEGNGPILLDNVNCYSTSYLHLLSCQYRTSISSICDHTEDVGIICCK